ncbi:hypothetical protein GT037_006752 [Alternaria burnsii]|uniref:LysM domain-containing protein n=1 Tax=Alternaria burnsii TaxID=1187904 RepID=A0A8H7B923_9PLEO|nr:uncharacterized protein GT037_006752 [Alternaria burnsii]KAF7674989.1 hypothetical protein GT037_006752 [Alternaria burnsii]
MQLTHFFAAGFLVASASAWPSRLRRAVDCEFSVAIADIGTTCESFASTWRLSVDELERLNPGINCPDLDYDGLYCVVGTNTDDLNTTTTSMATATSTMTTSATATTTPSTTINSSASTNASTTATTASNDVATSSMSSNLPASTDAADSLRVPVVVAGILGWTALVL